MWDFIFASKFTQYKKKWWGIGEGRLSQLYSYRIKSLWYSEFIASVIRSSAEILEIP